ncbi:hypothetical protein BOS5A_10692 [Bosea sp. EC-HK365B]|nr:hypothetical protein BOSE21B_10382 [Bosea sp. 21B]VVT45097.1 hypothetical protein BOS5A_10692 [Bosea sp. EC-HK365B]
MGSIALLLQPHPLQRLPDHATIAPALRPLGDDRLDMLFLREIAALQHFERIFLIGETERLGSLLPPERDLARLLPGLAMGEAPVESAADLAFIGRRLALLLLERRATIVADAGGSGLAQGRLSHGSYLI